MAEDSHMVKHWILEHGELENPPDFRFKIVGSFKDALSRQVCEAVRIESRGEGILNSKAEFNRCRIPRLRIDMEGWKKAKENCGEDNNAPEGWKAGSQDESSEENELRRMEETIRAEMDGKKRKSDEEPKKSKGRKKKKLKLDLLVDWGLPEAGNDQEVENENEELSDWVKMSTFLKNMETPESLKPNGWKSQGQDHPPEPTFNFKKRGKLTEEESKRIKKTNTSITSWLVKSKKAEEKESIVLNINEDEIEIEGPIHKSHETKIIKRRSADFSVLRKMFQGGESQVEGRGVGDGGCDGHQVGRQHGDGDGETVSDSHTVRPGTDFSDRGGTTKFKHHLCTEPGTRALWGCSEVIAGSKEVKWKRQESGDNSQGGNLKKVNSNKI
jgi:hypothetical protein